MAYYYSALNNAFYPSELRPNYTVAGEWPDDVLLVSDDIFLEFTSLEPPQGKCRMAGEDGLPVWADVSPPSHNELVADAETKKTTLLSTAAEILGPLTDAVDLDIATTDEKKRYDEWRKYRVLLMRVDVNQAPDIDWPPQPVK